LWRSIETVLYSAFRFWPYLRNRIHLHVAGKPEKHPDQWRNYACCTSLPVSILTVRLLKRSWFYLSEQDIRTCGVHHVDHQTGTDGGMLHAGNIRCSDWTCVSVLPPYKANQPRLDTPKNQSTHSIFLCVPPPPTPTPKYCDLIFFCCC